MLLCGSLMLGNADKHSTLGVALQFSHFLHRRGGIYFRATYSDLPTPVPALAAAEAPSSLRPPRARLTYTSRSRASPRHAVSSARLVSLGIPTWNRTGCTFATLAWMYIAR